MHGGIIALDKNFDSNTLAMALQVPPQNAQVSPKLINKNKLNYLSY